MTPFSLRLLNAPTSIPDVKLLFVFYIKAMFFIWVAFPTDKQLLIHGYPSLQDALDKCSSMQTPKSAL